MHVLVAFDKFKDALTASKACAVTVDALLRKHPDWTVEVAPLSDGGEGFCEILTSAVGGQFKAVEACGPRFESVKTAYGIVEATALPLNARRVLGIGLEESKEKIAVVEMASVSGLEMLPMALRDPMGTSTYGCGEVMIEAAKAGVDRILLGIGGSATNDLGVGALSALGLVFCSEDGSVVSRPIPANWRNITKISGSSPRPFPRVSIACDVANPLLGVTGAAATYGPQKGLKPADLPVLEREAARMAKLLCLHSHRDVETAVSQPGAGAAGGIGFGLSVALGAQFVPGANLVAAWLDLERKIAAADIVITGEGSFDSTSLHGKGPSFVIERSLKSGKRVMVFAGRIADNLSVPSTASCGTSSVELIAITPNGVPLAEALRRADAYLAESVCVNL